MDFFSTLWNDILVGGLQSGLLRLNDLTGSFGIAIILFTLIVRLVLFPLSVTSLRSSRRMQLLAPQLKALQRQHKGDRQAMGQAQMELYRQHGVNPLMGCLPMLAQLPVLFALYWAIINVTNNSADLEMAFLWIESLAVPDVWLPPGIELPFGLPGVLALTAGATQFVVQRMMMNRAVQDPQQQMVQNVMQFMPIMIVFFAMQFPAGLALYWVVSNIFSIGQQWVIMRDKSLSVPAGATAAAGANAATENAASESPTPTTAADAPTASAKEPPATKKPKAETARAPAQPQGQPTAARGGGLLGGLMQGGLSRSGIPDLTETTLQELGLDDADDRDNGAANQGSKTGKSRSRRREKRKGGGKR